MGLRSVSTIEVTDTFATLNFYEYNVLYSLCRLGGGYTQILVRNGLRSIVKLRACILYKRLRLQHFSSTFEALSLFKVLFLSTHLAESTLQSQVHYVNHFVSSDFLLMLTSLPDAFHHQLKGMPLNNMSHHTTNLEGQLLPYVTTAVCDLRPNVSALFLFTK